MKGIVYKFGLVLVKKYKPPYKFLRRVAYFNYLLLYLPFN